MVAPNGHKRGVVRLRHSPDETGHMRYVTGDVVIDEDTGIPLVLEIRCRDKMCCPKSNAGFYVHKFTLYGTQNGVSVGEYVKEYRQYQDPANLPLGVRYAKRP